MRGKERLLSWRSGNRYSSTVEAVFLFFALFGLIGRTAHLEMQMIIVFTAFTLPKPVTREEARRIFLSTAPRYQGVQGLFRKHYVLSLDGATAGGVYLWNSRPEAEAMYTESWCSFVREKYGTDPAVSYFESSVTVDNVTRQVLAGEQEAQSSRK